MNDCIRSQQPKDLFNITLEFIAQHAERIDCLLGFPDIIAKQIFSRFIHFNDCAVLQCANQKAIVSCFVTAYYELVLESVSLSSSLIVFNEFFDSFTVLFKFVREICLCSCYLGDSHELFENMQNFCFLNKLCLKKNCLRDESVRKITLPIRMFGRGPKNIEYLDLSVSFDLAKFANGIIHNAFTDAIIPWLAAFKKLQSLDLSGSNISIKSLHDLEKKCSLKLCNSESNIHPIVTKGWATPLIQRWNDVCKKRRESRNIEKRNMYFSKKRLQMAEESLSNTLNIRTSKSPKLVLKHVSFFGKNIESDAPAIEFLQQI